MTNNHTEKAIKDYSGLVKSAIYLAIIVAALSIFTKIWAYFLTGSLTILASLFDSFIDIATSVVNFVAIRYALQPPDNEHRFGHGKAEDLAVLTQAMFFLFSGLILLVNSIKRMIRVETIEEGDAGISLMLFSVVLTLILVIYQRYVIRKTQSSAIKSDNFHYMIDLIANLGSILAIILVTKFDLLLADSVISFAMSIYILFGAWSLLRKSFDNLMDRELSEEDKQIIKTIIVSDPRVIGFHDLKTRYSGNKVFVQLHLELDPKMTLMQAHIIVEAIQAKILDKMPAAEIIIHQDPEGVDEDVSYQD